MDFKNNFMAGAVLAAISMGSFAAEMNAGTVTLREKLLNRAAPFRVIAARTVRSSGDVP